MKNNRGWASFAFRIERQLSLLIWLLGICFFCSTSSAKGQTTASFEDLKARLERRGLSVLTSSWLANHFPAGARPLASDVSVDSALSVTLAGLNVEYSFEGPVIVFSLSKEGEKSRSIFKDIEGTVVDEGQHPLAGVSITAEHSHREAVTDERGHFRVPADGYATIVTLTREDYRTKWMSLSPKGRPYVRMEVVSSELMSVVVRSFEMSSRRFNTGDVSTIGQEDIGRQPVTNPLWWLNGRVPGLYMRDYNGVAGSAKWVSLGGRHSVMQDNAPLFVVNGVPLATSGFLNPIGGMAQGNAGANVLNFLPAALIDSIVVLQGPEATAKYGANGANGVVAFTLKKGQHGPVEWTAEASTGLASAVCSSPLLSTRDFLAMRREAVTNDQLPMDARTLPEAFKWDTTAHTNYQHRFTGNARMITNAGVQAGGGKWRTNFFLAGQVHRESTVFPGTTTDQRQSFYGALKHWNRDSRWYSELSGLYSWEMNALPVADLTGNGLLAPNAPDSTYRQVRKLADGAYAGSVANALLMATNVYHFDRIISIENRIGLNGVFAREQGWSDQTTRHDYLEVLAETALRYRRKLPGSILDLSAGFNAEHRNLDYSFETSGALPIHSAAPWNHLSIFGLASFNIKERLIFSGSFRRMESSPYGMRMPAGNFWSLGGAWTFYSNPQGRLLNRSRWRMDLGTMGNEPSISPAGKSTLVSNGDQPFWERSFRTGTAVDLELLRRKVFLSIGGYRNLAGNQWLVSSSQPGVGPGGYLYTQPGIVLENKAFEIEAKIKDLRVGSFCWSSQIIFTLAQNRLSRWRGVTVSPFADTFLVGRSLSVSSSYHWTGVDPSTGLYTFQTKNANGLPGPADKVPTAGLDPYYFLGWSQVLEYGNWELSLFFDYRRQRGANPLVTLARANAPGEQDAQHLSNGPVEWLDHWRKPGDQARQQRVSAGADPAAMQRLQYYMESDAANIDASYLRLRNAYLSWSLPGSSRQRWQLSEGKIFLNVQNIWTLTHFPVTDPETQDPRVLPPLRMVILGMKVGFK